MPITFPAHQAPVLPVKLRWPDHVDATAMCVAAAAPDLAYPLGRWLHDQSHTAIGVVVWAIPLTVVVATVLRWRAASGVFAHLPDMGPLRLRSYRVLGTRRPRLLLTVTSAAFGATTHIVIDGFTHDGRWGANWLGLNRGHYAVPFVPGTFSDARILQYLGHTLGSLAALALFAHIGNRRLVERWYGDATTAAARTVRASGLQHLLFWSICLAPPVAAVALSLAAGRPAVFAALGALLAGLLLAGSLPLQHQQPQRVGTPSRR